MPYLRILCLPCVLLFLGANAFAEGFAMTEWSARGLSLAGGMVARADDASAVAYNPAGITQLPGVHLMAGGSLLAPYGQIETRNSGATSNTSVRQLFWFPPHLYATWQLSDDWWLGFGLFSRFGLGNQYPSDWAGRYDIYNVSLQTVSANPVIAYKVNDWLSLAVGAELMYLHIMMEKKVAPMTPSALNPALAPFNRPENDMNLQGESWGLGMNAAAHLRINEQWSVGLTYRSQMTHNVRGRVKFGRQYNSELGGQLPEMHNSNASATVQFPDSAALAVMWKPLPNLSFEVGTIWTRWSTYNALNVYPDRAPNSISQKSFRDGWNFNASVEYRPLDWLALRLGYWYETPVVNEKYAEYMLPSYGRDVITAGVGFRWDNWTLDLAYAHIWIHSLNYDRSAARSAAESQRTGLRQSMFPGASKNGHTDIFSLSLGYSF
jgi:long-chain fatty acid transport protein